MIVINTAYISIIIIAIIIFAIFLINDNMVYVESKIDGKKYLVRDLYNKQEACDMLAILRNNIYVLADYLKNNIHKYEDKKEYIIQLNENLKYTNIKESGDNSVYTSYSVNKGEEIYFCLRSKKTNKFHDINLLMYVTLHELAHVATPEYGHTPLFNENFRFLTNIAIDINLFTNVNFRKNPVEYCGLTVSDSIV